MAQFRTFVHTAIVKMFDKDFGEGNWTIKVNTGVIPYEVTILIWNELPKNDCHYYDENRICQTSHFLVRGPELSSPSMALDVFAEISEKVMEDLKQAELDWEEEE